MHAVNGVAGTVMLGAAAQASTASVLWEQQGYLWLWVARECTFCSSELVAMATARLQMHCFLLEGRA